MKWLSQNLPGVLLCVGIMLLGSVLADWLGLALNQLQGLPASSSSPVSAIFVTLILGLFIRNIIGLQQIFNDGVTFSIKYLLRFGIILLGIRLSFIDVVKLGFWGIPIILTCVITGLLITLWVTKKMNQPHRLGTLIAVGTGICGVTAIMGTSPGIKANDEEVAYAIANVTLFGILAMFLYPYLAFFLFDNNPIQVGLFLGTAIHETAQVAGAALIYDQVYDMSKVVDIATITKLTRNFLLVAVVPIMSYFYLRKVADRNTDGSSHQLKWFNLIPLFVIGFIVLAIVRTIGDSGIQQSGFAFGMFEQNEWKAIWSYLNILGTEYMLGIAMAGVGLSTSLSVFKGLGIKPFYIGIVAAISVSIISLIMVSLLGNYISL